MERREKDFEKIEHIEKIVVGLANDFKTHTKVQELTTQITNTNITKLSDDIKDQKKHFDGLIERNKEHFDERINTCHREIHDMLKEEYATKAEIHSIQTEIVLEQTKTRTKDIEEAKKDVFTRVRNLVAVISSTIILIFIILTYILGVR